MGSTISFILHPLLLETVLLLLLFFFAFFGGRDYISIGGLFPYGGELELGYQKAIHWHGMGWGGMG